MINANTLLQLGPAARWLKVSPEWLKAEAEAGRVPCLKAGDRFLFNVLVVERLLMERAAQAKGNGHE